MSPIKLTDTETRVMGYHRPVTAFNAGTDLDHIEDTLAMVGGMVERMSPIKLTDSERTRCEVWSRVMGYHRPVSAFNNGKQQEHKDRRLFRERPLPG